MLPAEDEHTKATMKKYLEIKAMYISYMYESFIYFFSNKLLNFNVRRLSEIMKLPPWPPPI